MLKNLIPCNYNLIRIPIQQSFPAEELGVNKVICKVTTLSLRDPSLILQSLFHPPFACSQKVKVSETGYGWMKLGISSQDLPDFLFHQDSTLFEAEYEHSTEGKSKGGGGVWGNSNEHRLRWENQFGPLLFSHVLFISPTFDFVPNFGKTGAQYLQVGVLLHTDNAAANISNWVLVGLKLLLRHKAQSSAEV